MPIKDSIYTDPDSIRLLYINPKNPLRALSEVADADGAQVVASTNTLPISTPVSITPGGGGGGGGGEIDGCPAVGQYSLRFVAGRGACPVLVEDLLVFKDLLWNPIERSFRMVTAAEVVEDQECVKVTTMDDAESIVSATDKIIRSFLDSTGLSLREILGHPNLIHPIVSSIEMRAAETAIRKIESAGRLSIVKISLDGNGIYASGTHPDRMTLRHNNKKTPGGGGPGGDGGFEIES